MSIRFSTFNLTKLAVKLIFQMSDLQHFYSSFTANFSQKLINMARKKIISSDETSDNFGDFADLPDNEKVVITNTQTIEKKTIPTNQPPTNKTVIDYEPPETEFENEPDFDLPPNSLAALINKDEDEFENEFCSVAIRREPDNFGDRFLNPCSSRLTLPAMRNVELMKDRDEIEEIVREIHGGGHYFFQIHYDGRLAASWKESLSDSPEAIRKAKAAEAEAKQTPPTVSTTPPQTAITAVNPFDQFFDTLKKQKEMKELLFGDELKELEDLRRRDRERQTQTPTEPQNEKLQLLQYAEKLPEKAQEKILGFVFGESDGGILETAKFIFDNQDTVISFASKAVSAFFGGKSAPPPTAEGFEALMKGDGTQKKETAPPPRRSNFRRNKNPKPADTSGQTQTKEKTENDKSE